ncbi:MAG: hypothetical protein ABWY64_07035 [Tardiphaga sp.]
MNKIAAVIAAGAGATFMALGFMFPQKMSALVTNLSLDEIFSSDHARARAAVYRLLIDPNSASFEAVRTVDMAQASYVCGNVNSKDKAGQYAGHRAFVYAVALDSARIDDDGRIVRSPGRFTPCPTPEEAKPPKLEISPQALEIAGKVLKVTPKIEPEALTALAGPAASLGAPAAPGSSSSPVPELQVLASRTPQVGASGGGQTGANLKTSTKPAVTAGLPNESAWRTDQPPAAWPTFPADDPLAKPADEPADKRSSVDALAFAGEIDRRWASFRDGKSKTKPSAEETRRALRGLLTIDPSSEAFPRAWALFVRLRQADRSVG